MISASLLAVLFSISPAAGEAEAPAPTIEHASASDADYSAALERVRKAQQMANDNPERGAVQLRDALQLLRNFAPQLATDPEGQDVRTMGQLTLARALLATEDADGAREVMDEAIRTSRGDPLPTKSFGPGLSALHRERESVLDKQGTAKITVNCKQPCSIYINERPTDAITDGLLLGTYRLYVEAEDGQTRALDELVVLDAADQSKSFEFGKAPVDNTPPPKTTVKRIMPRWAEATLMGVGLVGVGVGAALFAIDGSCPGGADPLDKDACPQVYITRNAGIITMAAGGAVFLTGTITLAVDEVRVKRGRESTQSGTSVALLWTMRF